MSGVTELLGIAAVYNGSGCLHHSHLWLVRMNEDSLYVTCQCDTSLKISQFNVYRQRNNFLANLRKRAQFSKHSVSFSEPYIIVTESSESAKCRLDLDLFQTGTFHGTYAFTRYQDNAIERPFSISALCVYDVAQKSYSAVYQIYQAIRTTTCRIRLTYSQSASSVGASQLVARCQIWSSLPPILIIDWGFPDPAKLFELTPCGRRNEKKKQFLQQC
jgi:hypothetical protein